jgi:hypothetical protein
MHALALLLLYYIVAYIRRDQRVDCGGNTT